jgi:hypothetical protein
MNYHEMTMDQLMERQKFIYKKYIAAANGGASEIVMSQMLDHMEQIRTAMWELGYKESFKAQNQQDQDPFKDSIA